MAKKGTDPIQLTLRSITPEFQARSAAAKKGWKTRRENLKQKQTPQERRSAAAKKGWETRRRKAPEFQRRSAAAKKGWETRRRKKKEEEGGPVQSDQVLQAVLKLIADWEPDDNWKSETITRKREDKNELARVLSDEISSSGRDVVARRLEENPESLEYANTVLYAYEDRETSTAFAKFVAVLRGRPLTVDESKKINEALTSEEKAEADAELEFLGVF